MKIEWTDEYLRIGVKGKVYKISYWILIGILFLFAILFFKVIITVAPIPKNTTFNTSGWYGPIYPR